MRRPSSRPAELEPAIGLSSVSQRFGDVWVLRGIDLQIRSGTIAVVIGGSGTGKTTLLRIMIGLLRPTAGEVFVQGSRVDTMKPNELRLARSQLGMVFQYSALLDSLSVLDNVALPLREHSGLPTKEIDLRAREMLAHLELAGVEDRFPAELSGGMRKRVALARALIRRPSIVMYDEPTSGLDPLTARRVDDLILRTRDRFGVTSVVISHDMAGALRVADHLLLLDGGRLVEDGPPRELVRREGSLAARFLAASRPPV